MTESSCSPATHRSSHLLAMDRMIESVQAEIAENDPGNHATIAALNGELKGLLAGRLLLELAFVPSETLCSEPIAWYTEHDGGGAHCRLTIYEKPKNKVPGVEWIPLYAAPVSAVSATPCSAAELKRLREIEHMVWHVLDDSEEDVMGNISIRQSDDYLKLSDLLPEEHPGNE